MASSVKEINISKIGGALELLVINANKPNAPEYYSLGNVKSVVPTYNLNIGRNGIDNPTTYPFKDQLMITINFTNEDADPPIRFDIQTIANQAGWTADLAGLIVAAGDISGWIPDTAAAGSTGAGKTTTSTVYVDAVPHTSTPGKNSVIITCVTGAEEINGIVRPASVYTFQPTGGDFNNPITFNANSGRLIIDEL